MNDYDYSCNYHLDKANIVANALSRMYAGFSDNLSTTQPRIMEDMQSIDIDLVPNQYSYMLSTLTTQPLIIDKIKEGQASDPALIKIKDEVI